MSGGRIGLLGGTFDPVHNGHLQLAKAAKQECGLEKVVFIPCAIPPHKPGVPITSFAHRFAMLSLACQEDDGFECSDIENRLPTPSYTIDTIRELLKQNVGDRQFYFILGADAFLDILSWKLYQEVLQSVNIILSQRKGCDWQKLVTLLRGLGFREEKNAWYGKDNQKDILLLHHTPDEQCASDIRPRIKAGDSVKNLVPEKVVRYIYRCKLYQSDDDK